MKKRSSWKRFFEIKGMRNALTAFAGLVVIYIVFGIINTKVFSLMNFLNVLRSMSKYLLVGIGQSYVMITGNIDLSIGSVVAMSTMLVAKLMTMGVHPALAILVALACGLLIGVINGFLVGKFKLPPFIATLGTMFVARGVGYIVNNNRNTDSINSALSKPVADHFQNLFYYGKFIGIVFFFILSKTRTGRHIYAVGSNVDAARLAGVDVNKTTTITYLVSAFCATVVGVILCAQASMGNMEAGNMYEMYGVAAGVIGGVSPLGGSGLLLGTFAGAGVWQVLENGLNMVHAQVGIQRIVIGVIVVLAVLADILLRSRKKN